MRNLKYALLGMLSQESMTGYELMQKFETSLTEFWHAKHSQIYPELKKLTDEGMIEYSVEISGNVLERKVYTITKAGRKDFLEWLAKDEPMQPTPKDIFRLRMFFSNQLETAQCLKLLESQLTQHEARLAQLKGDTGKFGITLAKHTPEFYDALVLRGAILREESYCQWLKECIDSLES
jgi:DNA-binding PadR family transcriptional regulator